MRARNTCLGVSSPSLINQPTFVVSPFDEDFCIGSDEDLDARFVQRWDELMVTLRFGTTPDRYFESPQVQGSPYITLVYNNTTPLLASKADMVSPARGVVSGSRFSLQLGNGRKWVVYASKPLDFTVGLSNGTDPYNTSGPSRKTFMLATGPYTGVFMLAGLHATNVPQRTAVPSSQLLIKCHQ